MRAAFLIGLTLIIGCAPVGGDGVGAEGGAGLPAALVVDFGWGFQPNKAPRCLQGWNEPLVCRPGESDVAWMAYQDGTGTGCALDPAETPELTIDDPALDPSEQRWTWARICSAGPASQVAGACLCSEGGRCALPDLPLGLAKYRVHNDGVWHFQPYTDGEYVMGQCSRDHAWIVWLYTNDGQALMRRCFNNDGPVLCSGAQPGEEDGQVLVDTHQEASRW